MIKTTIPNTFPVTRFRGSKRKILSWIEKELSDFRFESVLDGFGGSSSVSFLFKTQGKKVTYNDYFLFNHIIAKALIENSKFKVSEKEMSYFLNQVEETNYCGVVQNNFSNIFFTDPENLFIDNYIYVLSKIKFASGEEYKKNILMYALFQACLIKRPYNLFHRANLSLRLNDVERSFNNKVCWDQPFPIYIQRFVREANSLVFSNAQKCISQNKNVFEINNDFDLVYLDPPYMDGKFSESADYLKCYHFLEGLARYDYWESMIDYDTKIKMIKREYFNDGLQYMDMVLYLNNLFEKFQNSIIVLSYRDNGYPDIGSIKEIMSRYKRNIKISSIDYNYVLSKNKKLTKEYLIIGY